MTTLSLIDRSDLPWLAEILDVVVDASGKPWRIALERLDDTRRFELPHAPIQFAAAVAAVQRILGGRARNATRARTARSLVLGKPALTAADRDSRIRVAAGELEVSCAALETMLWSDVPRERPIELPRGRPSELEVAAHANIQLLQRAMRRAHSVRLRIHGEAGPLIRGARLRGLLLTATRAPHGETVIDVVGPLALFHRTAVYGNALADLVPLLADCEHFDLEIVARTGDQLYTAEAASPILLPRVPARLAAPRFDLQRLLNELMRVARDTRDAPGAVDLVAAPCSTILSAGSTLVCPDLEIVRAGHRTYVELVGFWTAEFLRRKLELYRAAGITDVLLCVDESRGCTKDDTPDDLAVVWYAKRVSVLATELEHRTRR